MLEFVRTRPLHVMAVQPQAAQRAEAPFLVSPPILRAVANSVAISGFDGPTCVGCAGIVPVGEGAALVWAYLSADAGRHLLTITRKVRRVLAAFPADRFEATVQHGFGDGERWLLMLGFRKVAERAERDYFPAGGTAALYALERRHVRL